MNTYKTTLINLVYTDIDFNGFKWILKVLTRESRQRVYSIIKIEKDLIVGTDGHRLHIYYPPSEPFPSGIYKVLVKTRTQITLEKVFGISYPDWHNLLPAKENLTEIKLSRIDSVGYTELVRQMNPDSTLTFDYFIDLGSEITKAFIPSKVNEGVFFENFDATKKALIMPMRA